MIVSGKQPRRQGIINPWFSKRRNKAWYRMARLGADFYQDLVSDLKMMVMTRASMISLVASPQER